jgi:hypothetical protein
VPHYVTSSCCAVGAAAAAACFADSYNFCIVPNSSYDVVLFGGLAVVLACLLQGKLNTLMVLVAGEAAVAVDLRSCGDDLCTAGWQQQQQQKQQACWIQQGKVTPPPRALVAGAAVVLV